MTHIETSHGGKSYVRPQKARPEIVDPAAIFVGVIKQKSKTAGREAIIATFKRMVLPEEACKALERIVDDWISLRYTSLDRIANPPTAADIRRRELERRAELTQRKERIRLSFLRRIWEFVITPDGKRAHECTLQQVADQFSSLAAAITVAGKGKMNKRTDSVFKSPEAFMAAIKRAGHA